MTLATYSQYAQFGGSAAAGIGGAITSIFGAINTMKAAKSAIKSAENQAAIQRYNAKVAAELAILNGLRAETSAARERDLGRMIAFDTEREGRRKIGSMRANAAASGITDDFSVVDVLAAQAYENGRAVSSVATEFADREAAYRVKADDFRRDAQFARIRGEDVARRLLHDGRTNAATLRTRSTLMFARSMYGFGNTISAGGSVFDKLPPLE